MSLDSCFSNQLLVFLLNFSFIYLPKLRYELVADLSEGVCLKLIFFLSLPLIFLTIFLYHSFYLVGKCPFKQANLFLSTYSFFRFMAHQVAFVLMREQDFSGLSYFKSFSKRFFRFDFGHFAFSFLE